MTPDLPTRDEACLRALSHAALASTAADDGQTLEVVLRHGIAAIALATATLANEAVPIDGQQETT